MLTANRYPCEYFRVAYYGKGFASNLRNKEFIYCGNPLERYVLKFEGCCAKY